MRRDVGRLFMDLFAFCRSSLEKCLCRSFAHFFKPAYLLTAVELYTYNGERRVCSVSTIGVYWRITHRRRKLDPSLVPLTKTEDLKR